jgi:hypothetical protein
MIGFATLDYTLYYLSQHLQDEHSQSIEVEEVT